MHVDAELVALSSPSSPQDALPRRKSQFGIWSGGRSEADQFSNPVGSSRGLAGQSESDARGASAASLMWRWAWNMWLPYLGRALLAISEPQSLPGGRLPATWKPLTT